MTAVFVVCALALIGGQDHRAVGAEWFVVSAIAAAVYVIGYFRAVRLGGDERWLRAGRVVGTRACYVVELTGAALLFAGVTAGLYLAAVTMVTLLAFMISGAWLIVIGTTGPRPGQNGHS